MALLTVPRMITTRRAVAKVREEHDRWAASAELGRHYTIAPTSLWVEGIGPAVHSYFDFEKLATSGIFKGQLITERGRSSWSLWREFGAFTPVKKYTAIDARIDDAKAAGGAMARAQQAVAAAAGWDSSWAQAARDYPETMRALQAA
jgi:hypothetical protein